MASTNADRRAAALMIQRLPPMGLEDPDAEDDWRRAVIMMSTATPEEVLEPVWSASQILYRLFHEDGVRVYHQKALRHDCRCSRQKVERTLRSFPRSEVLAMMENDLLTVDCEFCKSSYLFNERDLDMLWA
jgi:molecular chaperone Hsp33